MTQPFDICITKKSVLCYLLERKAKNQGGIPFPNLMAEFVRPLFVENIRLTTRMERTLQKLEQTDKIRRLLHKEKHKSKDKDGNEVVKEYEIYLWSAR